MACDDAFHFYYEDNLRRLEAAGAELVRFAPTREARLPDVHGLYFGGGYPEALAAHLSSNRAMLDAVRGFAQSGGPIYAECGGLMYLSDCIRTLDGRAWPMVGLVAGEAVMSERLQALGYVEVETQWRVDSRAGRDADAGSSVPLLDAHAGSGANGARVRGASAMGRTIRGGLSLRQRARLLRACPLGVESQGCRGIRKLLRRLAQTTEPVTRPSLSPLHFRL